jgi:hypothetical protein
MDDRPALGGAKTSEEKQFFTADGYRWIRIKADDVVFLN